MRIKGPVSPSGLALFRQCPYKFYLHYSGYPRLPPPHERREPLDFGRLIHRIIARYYEMLPSSVTPEAVKGLVAKAFQAEWDIRFSHLRRRAEHQLLNFIRFEQRRISWGYNPRPLAVEKHYEKGIIHGIVDALFRAPNGSLVVVDWKTGKGRMRLTEDIVFQMNVYMYLTGADRAYALFLEHGEWYELRRSIDVESIVREIVSMDRFPKRRGPWCVDCEYQLACMGVSDFEETPVWIY